MTKPARQFGIVLSTDELQLQLLPDLAPIMEPPDKLRKAVGAVHMYPINGSYNHFCRKVFNALLSVTLRTWQTLSAAEKVSVLEERKVLRLRTTVAELGRILRTTTKASERIYEAVEALYRLEFRLDVMRDQQDVWKVASRLISQWAQPEKGTGEIQWEYPPDIFELLISPSRYAAIDMRLTNRLSSGHALALYENTYRYIGSNSKLTARLPVGEWIRLIVTTSAADAFAEPGRYRYFKRDILVKAMKELETAETCPFLLELLETKGQKNKVTHIQFKLVQKTQLPLPTDTGQTGDPRLEEKMRGWGVHHAVISRFLMAYEEAELWHHVNLFEKRVQKGGIRNVAAAFVDTVTKNYNPREPQGPKLAIGNAGGEALDAPAAPARESGKQLVSEFAAHISNRIREVFAGLTSEQQESAIQLFFERDGLTDDFKARLKKLYDSQGIASVMFSGNFFAWFGKQEGILVRPEELSLGGYREWQMSLVEETGKVLTSKVGEVETVVAKKKPPKSGASTNKAAS